MEICFESETKFVIISFILFKIFLGPTPLKIFFYINLNLCLDILLLAK